MNWITNFVKPKLKSFIRKNDIPDNLWIKCDKCEHMIFHRILAENFHVCHHCGNHLPFPIEKRLEMLFDKGFEEIPLPEVQPDPLKFKDLKKYTDRLKQYRKQTKREDAVILAEGKIGGKRAIVFLMDFQFMGGSMGSAVGEAFAKAAKIASEKKALFLAITASGGARMQEAVVSLMQMPKTIAALELLKKTRSPYLVLLTNPTLGGVTASFAMLGDIAIAEPGCLIGFAGPRVIEQTIRQKLPEGFQTAEYLLENGMIDAVVARKDQKSAFEKIIRVLG